MDYLLVKYPHILSATLLFGTGLGSAFYKWRADRSGDLAAIAVTNKNVVLADWIFTTPTVLIQPLTGVMLARQQGYSFNEPWLWLSITLFLIAGVCWLIVVYLQLKMRDHAMLALSTQTELPTTYRRQARAWFWLGIPAFVCILLVYALMVWKPIFFLH
ncbi:MAG: hypothetical protein AMJ53_07205 [Gammaproteobacteria bacterium SG8_11]|nr:MAG: hypothetical protein AMJ53_07205 [Gammaproteobacteria bacterium SG8_11]